MYRSTDKDFMEEIKANVLHVTKGQPKEDRKFAIDYLRKHVKLDDLHELAKKSFPGKAFEFGSGSYNPKVVVVTKDPISHEQKTKLEMAWKKLKVEKEDVFYAHLRFIKTKRKQQERQELFNKLLNILSPQLVVTFDNVTVESKATCYKVGHSISILTDADAKESRKELTKNLRSYKKDSIL